MSTKLGMFLNKYSAVPNAFVDELFSLYDITTIQTDPIIDLDDVAKWLNVNKRGLMRTLNKSYKKDIDYILHKSKRKPGAGKYGGNNATRIMLTPDCFKRLCMLTKSPRGEDVRSYFIELESLVVRYTQQFVAGIEADDAQLRRNLRPRDPADSTGYVYVIKASEKMDGVYKIGRSKDLNKRLNEYQTGRADTIEVIYKLHTEALNQVEGCVRAWMNEHRYNGCKMRCNEVYKADIDLIKTVINKCDAVGRAKVEYVRRKQPTLTGGWYIVLRRDGNT